MARFVRLHVLCFEPERGSPLLVVIKQEGDALNAGERSSVEVREHATVVDDVRHERSGRALTCRTVLCGGGPRSKAESDEQACAEKHTFLHKLSLRAKDL